VNAEPPPLEHLRVQAALLGLRPTDEDLEAVRGFLATILPELAELEELLPPGTEP
jgi:hypothetical protein